MNQELKALAEKYFAAYPGENVLHISGDGQVFLHKNFNDGVNHQRRIDEKKSLITISRKMLVDKEDETDLGDVPNDNWKVADIKGWLESKNVEPKSTKKADLLLEVQEVLLSLEAEAGEDENAGEGDETKND
jgi:hypothetical protein